MLCSTDGEVVKPSLAEMEERNIAPFKYHHLGSFAYVGDNKAVLQLPIIGEVKVQTQGQSSCTTCTHRVIEWLVDHVVVEGSICQ